MSLVTGASSGMGRATALALAKHGSKILCCDLKAEPNPRGYEADIDKTTVQVIEQSGGEAFFQQVDISNFPQVEAAFEATIAVSTQKARKRKSDRKNGSTKQKSERDKCVILADSVLIRNSAVSTSSSTAPAIGPPSGPSPKKTTTSGRRCSQSTWAGHPRPPGSRCVSS